METRAPFVLIGAFVLAAIAAVFGFVYWQTAAYMTSRLDDLLIQEVRVIATAAPERRLAQIEDRLRDGRWPDSGSDRRHLVRADLGIEFGAPTTRITTNIWPRIASGSSHVSWPDLAEPQGPDRPENLVPFRARCLDDSQSRSGLEQRHADDRHPTLTAMA